jgi:hypothetical protein
MSLLNKARAKAQSRRVARVKNLRNLRNLWFFQGIRINTDFYYPYSRRLPIRKETIMNAVDVLKYGHLTILQAVENVPDAAWETPGVCGTWSVKEILAHLASFEQALVEVLNALLAEQTDPPPLVLALLTDPRRLMTAR